MRKPRYTLEQLQSAWESVKETVETGVRCEHSRTQLLQDSWADIPEEIGSVEDEGIGQFLAGIFLDGAEFQKGIGTK